MAKNEMIAITGIIHRSSRSVHVILRSIVVFASSVPCPDTEVESFSAGAGILACLIAILQHRAGGFPLSLEDVEVYAMGHHRLDHYRLLRFGFGVVTWSLQC